MEEGNIELSSKPEEPKEAELSKNQLKKLRKREKWLAIKQDKRRNAKLKRKLRLAEMRENGEDAGPTRKSLKRKIMKNSSCKIRVAIDLSFDEYMAEKDVNSLTCQLQHSYAANRRAENPLQLYFCGVDGKTKERLDRIGDYKGWDINSESESYEKVFPVESLVYLSSESDNVLTTLSEDKVYVIGGLVDHNKHKGLCHRLAEEKGIAHAQLPIGDYLDMKTRKVLTINQVFAILLRFTETKDWKQAFLAEMPQRKNVSLKEASSSQLVAEEQDSDSCHDNSVVPEILSSLDRLDADTVPTNIEKTSGDLISNSASETKAGNIENLDCVRSESTKGSVKDDNLSQNQDQSFENLENEITR